MDSAKKNVSAEADSTSPSYTEALTGRRQSPRHLPHPSPKLSPVQTDLRTLTEMPASVSRAQCASSDTCTVVSDDADFVLVKRGKGKRSLSSKTPFKPIIKLVKGGMKKNKPSKKEGSNLKAKVETMNVFIKSWCRTGKRLLKTVEAPAKSSAPTPTVAPVPTPTLKSVSPPPAKRVRKTLTAPMQSSTPVGVDTAVCVPITDISLSGEKNRSAPTADSIQGLTSRSTPVSLMEPLSPVTQYRRVPANEVSPPITTITPLEWGRKGTSRPVGKLLGPRQLILATPPPKVRTEKGEVATVEKGEVAAVETMAPIATECSSVTVDAGVTEAADTTLKRKSVCRLIATCTTCFNYTGPNLLKHKCTEMAGLPLSEQRRILQQNTQEIKQHLYSVMSKHLFYNRDELPTQDIFTVNDVCAILNSKGFRELPLNIREARKQRMKRNVAPLATKSPPPISTAPKAKTVTVSPVKQRAEPESEETPTRAPAVQPGKTDKEMSTHKEVRFMDEWMAIPETIINLPFTATATATSATVDDVDEGEDAGLNDAIDWDIIRDLGEPTELIAMSPEGPPEPEPEPIHVMADVVVLSPSRSSTPPPPVENEDDDDVVDDETTEPTHTRKDSSTYTYSSQLKCKLQDAGFYCPAVYTTNSKWLVNFGKCYTEDGNRSTKAMVKHVSRIARVMWFVNDCHTTGIQRFELNKLNNDSISAFCTHILKMGIAYETVCSYLKSMDQFLLYLTYFSEVIFQTDRAMHRNMVDLRRGIPERISDYEKQISIDLKQKWTESPNSRPEFPHDMMEIVRLSKTRAMELIKVGLTQDTCLNKNDFTFVTQYICIKFMMEQALRPTVMDNLTVDDFVNAEKNCKEGQDTEYVVNVAKHKTAKSFVARVDLGKDDHKMFSDYMKLRAKVLAGRAADIDEGIFFICHQGTPFKRTVYGLSRMYARYGIIKEKQFSSTDIRKSWVYYLSRGSGDGRDAMFRLFGNSTVMSAAIEGFGVLDQIRRVCRMNDYFSQNSF